MDVLTLVISIIIPIFSSIVAIAAIVIGYCIWRKSEQRVFGEWRIEADNWWRKFRMEDSCEAAEQAQSCYLKALERNGKRKEKAQIYFRIGQCCEHLGWFPEALEAYCKCRGLEPKYRDINDHIARLRVQVVPTSKSVPTEDVL